jgi:hypothetical protein
LEVKMAITNQSDRRKSNRRESDRSKGDKKIIKIDEEARKEQEMTVGHGAAPKKKAGPVWSGMEEFRWEWSETFLTKKRGTNRKRGK